MDKRRKGRKQLEESKNAGSSGKNQLTALFDLEGIFHLHITSLVIVFELHKTETRKENQHKFTSY